MSKELYDIFMEIFTPQAKRIGIRALIDRVAACKVFQTPNGAGMCAVSPVMFRTSVAKAASSSSGSSWLISTTGHCPSQGHEGTSDSLSRHLPLTSSPETMPRKGRLEMGYSSMPDFTKLHFKT